jgi:tRNA(fMet)-specific endonuclease VapC
MLDTSGYSAFKRGHNEALRALQVHPEILVPAVVLGELLGGFAAGSRAADNRRELEEFLDSPRVQVVTLGADTAERYASIYARLRAAGRPIPTNDLWIAASAMEHGARLLTADEHYQQVSEILLSFLPPSKRTDQ